MTPIYLCIALLLVWDVDVELLPVCARGPDAVELGDDLDQVLAAEQEVSFDGWSRPLQNSSKMKIASKKTSLCLLQSYS